MASASPALGQQAGTCDPARGCVTHLSAPDVFAIADRYAAAGRLDEAETLLKGLTHDPNSDYRAEARFRLSVLREKQGDRQGAIEWLKALLDEKPNAQRPRLELARLLALQGDESGARRELRRAGAAGLPEDVARVVNQFALALRSSRPIGGAIEVAIAPDSNINRATSRETVDTVIAPLILSPDARERSGLGFTVSGQAFARADLTDGLALLSRVSARADLYGASRFDDIVLTLASGPEFRWAGARIRPAAVTSRRWFGGDLYSESYGGSLNVLKPLNRVSQIESEFTALRTNYRLIPDQDGMLYDFNTAYDRAFSPRFSGRISARVTRQDAVQPSLATTSAGIDLLASRSFGKQLVFVEAGVSKLWSDARLPLFTKTREDTGWEVTGGLLLRRFSWRGLSPVVRIIHSENASTVGIYRFKRTRIEFALSREF